MALKKLKLMLMRFGWMKLKARVLVLGLCNSGKTTVVKALAGQLGNGVAPTMGYEVETVKMKKVKLTTFDMSGQSKYQTLWSDFYDEANGVVFVVDAADEAALQEAKAVFSSVMTKMQPRKVPVLVLCNKMDIARPGQVEAIAAALELSQWGSLQVRLLPCCATHNEGLQEAMSWMTARIRSTL